MEAKTAADPVEFATKLSMLHNIIRKVVPRLLGNLKQNGEPNKSSLVHGDIWEPNLDINIGAGDLVMYEPDITTGTMKWIWQSGMAISARISAPEPIHHNINIYDGTKQNQRKSPTTATYYTASKVRSITLKAILDASPGKRKWFLLSLMTR